MVNGKNHFVRASKLNRLEVWGTDPNSAPRIFSPHGVGVREIAAWLSDDVNSRFSAIGWIERLESLCGTEAKGYLGTGNAHHEGVVDDYIYLECEFVEAFKAFIQREHIISVLKFYIGAHEGYTKNIGLDVEFEMEGEQA